MADLEALQALYRYWPKGLDSWTAPKAVNQLAYVWAQNVLNKGGIPQTRPGSRSLACMPKHNPQGCGLYTPENGVTHLMVAVNGAIFVAPQPFREEDFRQLIGLNFNPNAKFITFTECLKTTDYDADGELFYLERPYRVVIIQDGLTRSAFWDGSVYQHQNPTPSNAALTVDNRDETKIGLWGAYSNNRYWVARGRFVFASDIGNPLKFHESQYLNESPAFILPDNCTGIIETPDRAGILCFYEQGADLILSSVQDREQWLEQPDEMQKKVLNVGCIAPRSLINQNGLIYWFSPRGWISQNEALRSNISSVLDPLDDEMAYSKSRLGPDLSRIAAGSIENVSLVSVPFCSLRNSHTWALDTLPLEEESDLTAWASVWTGWQPVCWVTGEIDGYQRIFFLSADTDGNNRIWEGFTADKKDNGCDITCFVQFRQEEFNDPLALKRFRFAELEFSQLAGTVSAMVAVAGSRGWFDRLMTHEMVATYERVEYDQIYGEGSEEFPLLASSRKQSRIVRSQEWNKPSDCNACGIEGQRPVNFDQAFNVFVGWSGRAAITQLRLVASEETYNDERGDCPPDETGPNVVDGGGCSAKEMYPVLEEAFPKYFATSFQESTDIVGNKISWEASAFSQISQKDAQRRADCKAFQQLLLNSEIGVGIPQLLVYNEAGTVLIGDLIDFGFFLAGQSGEITVRLVNEGTGVLDISNIAIPDSVAFQIIDGPDLFSLDPGAFTFLTLKFGPVDITPDPTPEPPPPDPPEPDLEPETEAWEAAVAAAGGTLEADSVELANDLVVALKAESWYGKIRYLLPFLGADINAVLAPLVDPLGFGNATNDGFVDADFDQTTGVESDGTQMLILPFNVNELGSSTNGGFGVWVLEIGASQAKYVTLALTLNGNVHGYGLFLDNIPADREVMQWGGGDSFAQTADTPQPAYYHGERRAANDRELYRDGVSIATDTDSVVSNTGNATDFRLFGHNGTVDSPTPWAGRLGLALYTRGTMSDAEVAALYSILNTFMTATGRIP